VLDRRVQVVDRAPARQLGRLGDPDERLARLDHVRAAAVPVVRGDGDGFGPRGQRERRDEDRHAEAEDGAHADRPA
jgi:hypothetical protein